MMLPGLLLSALLAIAAMVLSESTGLQQHGLSALALAIVLGMLAGNTMPTSWRTVTAPGIDFSKQRLLRLGIVLYGFRLTLQDVAHVGMAGVLIDALVIGSTFALACLAGSLWFGLDRRTSMLIGIGSSICGAAAVIAAQPVVNGRAEQVAVAVATVVVFGTVAIFLYPMLHTLNGHWGFILGGQHGFGVYTGSTVHEVAQVVAAGRSVGPEAADTAVIAKMVRVMMLAPFLLILAAWLARRPADAGIDGEHRSPGSATPWFAFGFIAVVLFNSLQLLPPAASEAIDFIDTVILAAAMAALGVSTRAGALRQAGIKPLLLAFVLFAWLVIGGASINRLVMTWLG